MPINSFVYEGVTYPELQKEGFASQYIFPFAAKVCKELGSILDIPKKNGNFLEQSVLTKMKIISMMQIIYLQEILSIMYSVHIV